MSEEIRNRIVEIARAELGPGRVSDYWQSALGSGARPPWPKHWCGAFALWCLHRAGVALDVRWKIGLGFLEVQRLPKTRDPKPGDVAYFDQPFQHHAVVERLANDGLYTIDGNQGGLLPVKEKFRKLPTTAIYYSIEPFLKAATPPPPVPIPPILRRVTLKRGDKSEAVKELQTLINLAGIGVVLVVDGNFGPRCEAAVRVFQTSRHLHPDGIVGNRTWAALDAVDGAS